LTPTFWFISSIPEPEKQAAWAVQERFGLSWWDALIVAAARMAECSHLLTEDLQHGQDFGDLRVVNPFKISPEELSPPASGD
jgi:predicted nucleic acid-binding protein